VSSVYSTPEWAAWLASIREMPDDDNRRMIAADFLEDNGEGERAEFIRCQVELAKTPELVWRNKLLHKAEWQAIRPRAEPWGERFELASPSDAIGVYHYRETNPNHVKLYGRMSALADGIYGPTLGPLALHRGTWVAERGFVSRVSGPLVSLIGERGCNRCVGGGREPADRHGNVYVGECPDCTGTGRTSGVLRELVKREPVAARGIEVTDREPSLNTTGNVCWFHEAVPHSSRVTPDERRRYDLATLPADVFDALPPQAGGEKHSRCQWYKSADAARAALSAAILRLVQPVEVPT